MKRFALLSLACALSLSALAGEPRRPLGFGPSAVGGKSYQGEEITADLPLSEMFWNIGSKVDGAGMCVDTSLEQSARHQGLTFMRGFRDWAARFPGGGYPQKVDEQIARYCREKGVPVPGYLQYTGSDAAELNELLELIDRTGRMACIAYGYSPRYGGPINHMVFSPKCGSGEWAAVVDNNAIGGVKNDEAARFEWMRRSELVVRMCTQRDRFGRPVRCNPWVFVWLAPPPPAPPAN